MSVHRILPQQVHQDITLLVERALHKQGAVNVPVLADELRRRNEAYNIALEDIAGEVLRRAQMRNAVIVFDAADGVWSR